MSNPLKNRIRIEGHEYDLCYCSAPEFALSGIELPAPFQMLPGVKGRYKSLIIAGQFFGVIPVEARKTNPLTHNVLVDVFKWTRQEQFGSGWKFNKQFTGHRWFELYFDASNNDVKLTVFRLKSNRWKTSKEELGFKQYVEEQVLFDGEINDIDDFEYICNILHID